MTEMEQGEIEVHDGVQGRTVTKIFNGIKILDDCMTVRWSVNHYDHHKFGSAKLATSSPA
jgi:hypothetical protein